MPFRSFDSPDDRRRPSALCRRPLSRWCICLALVLWWVVSGVSPSTGQVPDREGELEAIRVPALVLANRHDPVHPFSFGQEMTRYMPGAEFRELTAKSVDVDRHRADYQRHLTEFLNTHFPRG